MKTPAFVRLLSRGLVGSLGIGMLFGGMVPSAKALPVNPGTDYLRTPPGGATYKLINYPGVGDIDLVFSGLPIGTPGGGYVGLADTVVNRYDAVTVSGGTTNIEIVGLSLKSVAPVNILGTNYDVFAGLQKYYPAGLGGGTLSTGTMQIFDTGLPNGKTWESSFFVNAVAILAPEGALTPTGNDYVRSLIEGCDVATTYQCLLLPEKGEFISKPILPNNALTWSDTPTGGQITGPNLVSSDLPDFYLTSSVFHEAPDATHIVDPHSVPGPLPIFGVSTAFAFSRRLRKRIRTTAQAV